MKKLTEQIKKIKSQYDFPIWLIKETRPIGDVEAEKKYGNETLDEIAKTLEKYDIGEEFALIMMYGILMKNEKEKIQRKIDQLNSQYPISPFQTNV